MNIILKKIHSLKVHYNKIHKRLNKDSTRDKIRDRMLEREECND